MKKYKIFYTNSTGFKEYIEVISAYDILHCINLFFKTFGYNIITSIQCLEHEHSYLNHYQPEDVNSKIKAFRKKRKLSQDQVANEIGLSRSAYSNIEAGRHKLSIGHLNKLCLLFECKSSDLLNF